MDDTKRVFVELYGAYYEVVGAFTTVDSTNEFLENNPECGVLMDYNGWHIVANNNDLGVRDENEIKRGRCYE